MHKSISHFLFSILLLASLAGCGEEPDSSSLEAPLPAPEWYRGNLHTQSYWSDGDDYPEMILKWYGEQGYDFVAMSDHDRLAEGEKWISFGTQSDNADVFRDYLDTFGASRVEYEERDSLVRVRLKTFEEYRCAIGPDSALLVIQAEEISDSYGERPIHLNAVNLRRAVPPQGGDSVAGVIRNNLRAVRSQEHRSGQEMLVQLNHPNYGRSVSAADLLELPELDFMEIYNGHPSVANYGNDRQSSVEEQWDAVNAGRARNGDPLLYGTATDDAHNYHDFDGRHSNPGRGWIRVWSRGLTPGTVISAMTRGHFYASSGVTVRGIRADSTSLRLAIEEEEDVSYRTQFVGARDVRPADGGVPPDVVLAEAEGPYPSYTFRGDELFVRARVISSRLKENPYREGDHEMAWTQPVLPGEDRYTLGFFNSGGND